MKRITLLALILLSVAAISCSGGSDRQPVTGDPGTGNAVYYWKTTYRLSDWDKDFLKSNDIRRIYLRMFDVAVDFNWNSGDEEVMPIATTKFEHERWHNPPVEIVPVVYITLDAIRKMGDDTGRYADLIVTRVFAMGEYNNLGAIKEVQLDCDWTESTRDTYFELCKATGNLLKNRCCALSSTIRLHQLRQPCPPVDRGVLMLYNTGSFKNSNEDNSILSLEDVSPYLRNVSYSLPLDFAYPAYNWGILFSDGQFRAILHNPVLMDWEFEASGNIHTATCRTTIEGHDIKEGDVIRTERSDFSEVMKVKQIVGKRFRSRQGRTILYHLDSLNLSKYSSDEIHSIFSD